jgi:hypothetical protein
VSNSAPMRVMKGQDPMVKGTKSKIAAGAPVKSKAGKNQMKPGKAK